MKWLRNIIDIWLYDIKNALLDEGALVFFIIVPLLYPLLYAYLYGNEKTFDVPAVAVDCCNSYNSREFLRMADGTPDIRIVAHCADMQEALEHINRKEAYGLIYIPKEFDRDLMSLQQTTVELYCDMSGLLYYKAILSGCTDVSLQMNKTIKASRMPGATDEQISAAQYPIEYEYVPMFNTQSGFATYMIPAILMLIIQQTMLFGVGMVAGEEREKIRRGIAEPHLIGKKPHEILIGKACVYFAIYIIIAAYMVCIVPQMFHLIHIWDWRTMLAFMFPYVLSCVFFCITIAGMSHDREAFIITFVFMSIPLTFLSGISWPGSNIPHFWKVFSWIFPSTLGINGYVRISEMGAHLADVMPEIIGLWIQTGVYFIMAYTVYRKTYGKQLFA